MNFRHLFRSAVLLAVWGASMFLVQPAQAQTWSTGSPLKAARWAHTATLLTNGSVLITGGTITNNFGFFADTNACELFNPLTGTTTLTGAMRSHRHSHQATRLANGQVLVTGGGDASSETFDPASGTWINYASMSQERIAHTATLLNNGKVLVAGGYDDSGGGEVSGAELYDPNTETWANTATMPYAADTLAAALLPNGKVLVCGGYDGNNALTNAVLYNPANQTWATIAGMNEARSGHTATVLPDGTVLVLGGAGDNSAEVFDPVAVKWTYASSLNDGWLYPNTVLLNNGNVMVVGDGNSDVEIYDGNTWNYADSLPVAGNSQTATALTNGAVLVTGGSASQYNGPASAAVQIYGSLVTIPSLNVTNTPQSGVPPLTVHFTSPSLDSVGNTVTNWNWNFGDGTTSTNQNPVHVYNSVGNDSPSLTAYSTFGSTPLNITGLGAVSVAIPSLNASVNLQSGQIPLTVQFTTPGQDSDGFTVTNWNWTFGDGATSTTQNPSHTYLNPGIFSPTLVARSTYGSSPVTIVYYFTTVTVTNPPNPLFHTLHSFSATSGSAATNGDGTGPNGGLVLIGNTLFGTAQHGGSTGYGTLFSVHTDGSSFADLYDFSFTSTSGAIPPDGVILSGGTFYGATYLGGNRGGGGTIFAISTNGTGYTNLLNYNFNVDPNSGEEPQAGVVLAGNTLYGTTWFGGAFNHGTVSFATTNGASNGILHHFSTPSGPNFNLNYDGLFPSSKLIFANGTLYGTAEGGGTAGRGTVFAVDTNNPGSFRALYYFTATDPTTGTNTDGANPFAGLVLSGNTLYGTTFTGGRYGNGTIFAVNTNGTGFTNLYSFNGTNGGYGPHATLTLSGNTLYGTTSGGGLLGTLSSGTLFAINTDGSGFRNLYSFSGGSDGATPQGELVINNNTLYGTTAGGGGDGHGTVFSFIVSSAALPVTLLNPQDNGVNFLFHFTTQSGFNHAVQYRTNLIAGLNWQTYSNFAGDGNVKNLIIPISLFNPARQGFIRVSTQ